MFIDFALSLFFRSVGATCPCDGNHIALLTERYMLVGPWAINILLLWSKDQDRRPRSFVAQRF